MTINVKTNWLNGCIIVVENENGTKYYNLKDVENEPSILEELTIKEMEEIYNKYKRVNILHRPSSVFLMMDIIGKNGSQYCKTENRVMTLEQLKGYNIDVTLIA